MATRKDSLEAMIQQQANSAILTLEIFQNGSMNLKAPMPPKEVIKLLQNVCVELTFNALQEKEPSSIVAPPTYPGSNENH